MAIDFSFGDRSLVQPDVNAFLINLAVALQRRALYPGDHPSTAPTLAALTAQAKRLLRDRSSLSIGVANDRLIVDRVATDHRHALLKALAQRLTRHRLGALVLTVGLEGSELESLVEALAADPERDEISFGNQDAGRATTWPHVRLCPVSFHHLQLVDNSESEGVAAGDRTSILWLGLASAAVSSQAPGHSSLADDPFTVARAIESQPRHLGYERTLFESFLRIGEALRGNFGTETQTLRERLSTLFASVQQHVLEQILQQGDSTEREQLVRDAAASLSAEASLKLLRAAAEASDNSVPKGLLRMLLKLVEHTVAGSDRARVTAGSALREHLVGIVEEWPGGPAQSGTETLDDPPRLVERPGRVPRGACQIEPTRMVAMSLEVGVPSDHLEEGVEHLIGTSQMGSLIDALETSPANRATAIVWRRLLMPQTVHRLLGGQQLDLPTFDRLLPHLRGPALEAVFDVLGACQNRAIRRALLDRLQRLGSEINRLVLARLEDARWYVVRNMLLLIGEMPEPPAGFKGLRFLKHHDARVRVEALRCALKSPEQREEATAHVLSCERDSRVLWLALSSLRSDCPGWAVDPLNALIREASTSDELRGLALKVLGISREPLALHRLLELSGARASGLRDGERIASEALRILASNWSSEPAAREAVSRASSWFRPRLRARLPRSK